MARNYPILTNAQIASSIIAGETSGNVGANIGAYLPPSGAEMFNLGVTARHVFQVLCHLPGNPATMPKEQARYLKWLRSIFSYLGGYPAVYQAKQEAKSRVASAA